MTKKKVVRTREELLQILGLEKLPNTKKEMIALMNELAVQKVDLQGEALKLVSAAYGGILGGGEKAFESIREQLEPYFRRADDAQVKNLIQLILEVSSLDLNSQQKKELFEKLIDVYHEQNKQEKKIFGDLAKIGAVAVAVVMAIGSAAIGGKHFKS